MLRLSAVALFGSAALALVTGGTALGAGPPPPSQAAAAVAQYVETLPAAGGPTTGGTQANTAPQPVAKANTIPQPVAKAIQSRGGSDTSRLTNLLESPMYGGPADSSRETAAAKFLARPVLQRGSLATVVTSDPGGTAAFWVLIACASVIPFVLRRATQPRNAHLRPDPRQAPPAPGA